MEGLRKNYEKPFVTIVSALAEIWTRYLLNTSQNYNRLSRLARCHRLFDYTDIYVSDESAASLFRVESEDEAHSFETLVYIHGSTLCNILENSNLRTQL
jgi:hypothetical protein